MQEVRSQYACNRGDVRVSNNAAHCWNQARFRGDGIAETGKVSDLPKCCNGDMCRLGESVKATQCASARGVHDTITTIQGDVLFFW